MHTKILVVDDEPNILYVIERCFASSKMKVVTASNARAAPASHCGSDNSNAEYAPNCNNSRRRMCWQS